VSPRSQKNSSVTSINLAWNNIGAVGAAALATALEVWLPSTAFAAPACRASGLQWFHFCLCVCVTVDICKCV
jgi:hypothetical protein